MFFSYPCLDETEERKDGEELSFGIKMDKTIKGVHLFCSVTLVWCVMQSASLNLNENNCLSDLCL